MISQGDPVHLTTARGSILVKANLTETVFPGMVNMYHGYPEADVNRLIEPDYLDPISGYPGFKSLMCEVLLTPDLTLHSNLQAAAPAPVQIL